MAIENPTYIPDLNPLWPDGAESVTGADNHLRLIKKVLVDCLGSLGDEYLTITAEELNGLVDDVAACVLKAGDKMSGDLQIYDYKAVTFSVGEEDSIFGRVVGRDDRIDIEILDTDGTTVLKTLSITADDVLIDGVAVVTTADLHVDKLTIVRDTKNAGVYGGNFNQGWQTRDLDDTAFTDEIGVTLGTNQITIPAGTYWVDGSAPAHGVGVHMVAWHNVTLGTFVRGPNEYALGDAETRARIKDKFTVTDDDVTAGENIFELRHYAQVTNLDDGFGTANPDVANVYAEVILRTI